VKSFALSDSSFARLRRLRWKSEQRVHRGAGFEPLWLPIGIEGLTQTMMQRRWLWPQPARPLHDQSDAVAARATALWTAPRAC
jgi:hypothetical protein